MMKKIASTSQDIKLEPREMNEVRGMGCASCCPSENFVWGFCCRGDKGFETFLNCY
ncbi:MAG: hypothetical protein ACM3SY_11040 [Candidatus Omnitrophota bacterium]